MERRRFLELGVLTGGLWIVSPACARARDGAAYEPWATFPDPALGVELHVVHGALLAASPHNTQPWAFRVRPQQIEVHLDETRGLGPMDSLGREARIGLGCAIENAVVAAAMRGFRAEVELSGTAGPHIATLTLVADADVDDAAGAILTERLTNRAPYRDDPLPRGVREALADEVAEPARLTWVGDAEGFAVETVAATEAIVADTEMNEASHAWWRQHRDDIEEHRDGLTLDASGLGGSTRAFGRIGQGPDADRAGRYWIRSTETQCASVGAFGVLHTASLEAVDGLVEVGRSYQRVANEVASRGLAIQPLNQLAERRDREITADLPDRFGAALAELAPEHAQMLFRVGEPTRRRVFHSPRRPVAWVVVDEA